MQDCFTYLQQLNKQSEHNPKFFRLIIIDPPYGMTKNHWDQTIDLALIWKLTLPLLHPDGTILFFTKMPFTCDVYNSNPQLFRYDRIWEKEKGTHFFDAQHRPLPSHENVLIFSKVFPHCFHPQKTEGNPYYRDRSSGNKSNNYNKDSKTNIISKSTGERFPKSVDHYLKEEDNKEKEEGLISTIDYYPRDNANVGIHPTQKPINYLINLINSYSNEEDWILDLFGGSASSLIASLMANRNCICLEKDANQYEKSLFRINEFCKDGKDHLPSKNRDNRIHIPTESLNTSISTTAKEKRNLLSYFSASK